MPTALQGRTGGCPAPELWRITDRRTFQALRQQGRRARRGPLTVTWLAPAPGDDRPRRGPASPSAAPSGGAVLRNRIRRRLRAALRELQAERPPARPAPTSSAAGPSWPSCPGPRWWSSLEATVAEARS